MAKARKLLILWLLLFGGGVAFGVALARFGVDIDLTGLGGAFDGWPLAATVLPVLAAYVLVVFVHEAGHLVGGLAGGMRFLLMTVGPLRVTRGAQGLRVGTFWRGGGFGGLTAMAPDPQRPLSPQLLKLIAGGPLASGLLCLCGLALVPAGGLVAAVGYLLALMSGLVFLVTAIPFRIHGFLNDAARWREQRRGGPAAEQYLLMVALMSHSLAGTRPRDYDAALIARARVLDDGQQPLQTASLDYYDYLRLLDLGDIAAAGTAIDRIGALYEACPQGLRQAFAVELAYFSAACRNDATQAKQWLERGRGGLVEAAPRARSEAALALAEGRLDVARAAIARAEAALRHSYDPGGAQLIADQLQRLRERAPAPG